MSAERVDKSWHTKGIDMYSVPAILGTLAHYGVTVTEAEFLELAKREYPLAIASTWHEGWKGTGQFSRFPAAAAEELWRRLKPDEFAPTDLSLAVVNLLGELDRVLDKKPDDGTRETRFKVVENYLAKLPVGAQREKFLDEMLYALGEWMEPFDEMAEALATEGHGEFADRFVKIEETLIPIREGTAAALVQAAKGDLDGALVKLQKIATEAEPFTRISAIDALFEHEQVEDAKNALLTLVDEAEKSKDVELASEIVERMSRLLELDPHRADKNALRERVEQLARVLEG
ncbi:MAG: hypothetical protein DI536_23480 [Archangium gephyra]|uniref:Uncharacterized protein n=1 Tax=Archangium gephyra TaxID=48 RepID=A0A2W5UIN7_9BACT|nr:MAG: hypothetical protein DI536_23480 [Archangium gephyra]